MSPQPALDKTPPWFRNYLLNVLITIISVIGLEFAKVRLFEQPKSSPSTYVVTLSADQVDRFLDSFNMFASAQREQASSMRRMTLEIVAVKNAIQEHTDDVAQLPQDKNGRISSLRQMR